MSTPTPRTDAQCYDCTYRDRGSIFTADTGKLDPYGEHVSADFARQLERDITELNERLIDRQKTLMEQAVKLQAASRLLTRCRDSAGRMEMGLYEDIQNFLNAVFSDGEKGLSK
mgnify:CR=1 FL=1